MASHIKRVGVLGAGLMGHGIAQVSAQAGYEVVLWASTAGPSRRGSPGSTRSLF